jgi:CRP/FNR family transcriptional regulator
MNELINETYGGIFEKELIEEITSVAKLVEFKEGDVLIDIGTYIKTMPLLMDGAIKIMREDFDAGELLLYFLEKGDTCSMTLSCCMGDKKSEIRAVAENGGLVAMIPVNKMEEWLGKYKTWRAFVFESYNNRFNEMLAAIDNIAFMNMGERLYNYLMEKSKIDNSRTILKTHQEIAYELNSSRVVISRLLKAFENEGKIRLNRNNIELLS